MCETNESFLLSVLGEWNMSDCRKKQNSQTVRKLPDLLGEDLGGEQVIHLRTSVSDNDVMLPSTSRPASPWD